MTLTPTKSAQRRERRARRRYSRGVVLDWAFFVFAGLSAVWLAYLSVDEAFQLGWWGIAGAVVFWVLLAYLVLPRLHRILTTSTCRTTSSAAPARATDCWAIR